MKYKVLFLFLFLLAIFFVILEIFLGPVKIPYQAVINALFGKGEGKYIIIVRELRLPRAILGFSAGFALAIAGAVFQGVFKNPMAEPYVLGVASGAALGMSIGMIYLKTYSMLLAFIFAILTLAVVYMIAEKDGVLQTTTLLLAGIAISLLLSSATSLLLYMHAKDAGVIIFTLMGTLSTATWQSVKISLLIFPIAVAVYFFSKELSILMLGDEVAKVLGVDAEKVKKILLVLATLLTSIVVALCGIIGFVGLITPHISRIIAGQDFKRLIPFSAIFGSILLIIADIFAKTIIKPAEVPVNIITTFFGVPFFIYLLIKEKKSIGKAIGYAQD